MTQSNPRSDLTAAEWAVRLNERALTAQEQTELDRDLLTRFPEGYRHLAYLQSQIGEGKEP